MNYLKCFESFQGGELIDYILEFWEVDPYDLWEVVRDLTEDGSLKGIRFFFEKGDSRNIYFFTFNGSEITIENSLINHGISHGDPYRWFKPLIRKNDEVAYPSTPLKDKYFPDRKTNLHFELNTPVGHETILHPEIELIFERNNKISTGGISGEYEDNFNVIFKSRSIPYIFESEMSYNISNNELGVVNCPVYVLYHT